MNRYHHGFSTVEPSGLRSAHMRAQLKVENPVPLRTIENFDFYRSPRTSYRCRAITYFTGSFDKKSNSARQCRWRRKHCTQKERPALEGRVSSMRTAALGGGRGCNSYRLTYSQSALCHKRTSAKARKQT
jgi:hypothetical protein